MQTAPSRQLNYPIEPYDVMYAGLNENGFHIPRVPYKQLDPDDLRQIVHDPTVDPVGTVVIDPEGHRLYLMLEDRKAVRYGIALGPGFTGGARTLRVGSREAWPVFYASGEKKPDGKPAKDQPPGPKNPYGARALYLTHSAGAAGLVIHGTSDWREIGKTASTGSIAMLNQDVMDLDRRTKPGAQVIIL